MAVERLSIELSNRCAKACSFCYNASHPRGETTWTPDRIVELVTDCAAHGTRAVSLGGGEPLQYRGLLEILERLRGVVFRSLTSNGLLLDDRWIERLRAAAPDRIHLSIHFPEDAAEVTRVIEQVQRLADADLRSGVNLLVARSNRAAARDAAARLMSAGIGVERIVFLPMRGRDTPTPAELAEVAGGPRFQSMTCLMGCGRSPRFACIDHARRVAWCSYTVARRPLRALTAAALREALHGLPLVFCGEPTPVRIEG